jgi:hypothetical protein
MAINDTTNPNTPESLVLSNSRLLGKILSNLSSYSLFPTRGVARLWKDAIDNDQLMSEVLKRELSEDRWFELKDIFYKADNFAKTFLSAISEGDVSKNPMYVPLVHHIRRILYRHYLHFGCPYQSWDKEGNMRSIESIYQDIFNSLPPRLQIEIFKSIKRDCPHICGIPAIPISLNIGAHPQDSCKTKIFYATNAYFLRLRAKDAENWLNLLASSNCYKLACLHIETADNPLLNKFTFEQLSCNPNLSKSLTQLAIDFRNGGFVSAEQNALAKFLENNCESLCSLNFEEFSFKRKNACVFEALSRRGNNSLTELVISGVDYNSVEDYNVIKYPCIKALADYLGNEHCSVCSLALKNIVFHGDDKFKCIRDAWEKVSSPTSDDHQFKCVFDDHQFECIFDALSKMRSLTSLDLSGIKFDGYLPKPEVMSSFLRSECFKKLHRLVLPCDLPKELLESFLEAILENPKGSLSHLIFTESDPYSTHFGFLKPLAKFAGRAKSELRGRDFIIEFTPDDHQKRATLNLRFYDECKLIVQGSVSETQKPQGVSP